GAARAAGSGCCSWPRSRCCSCDFAGGFIEGAVCCCGPSVRTGIAAAVECFKIQRPTPIHLRRAACYGRCQDLDRSRSWNKSPAQCPALAQGPAGSLGLVACAVQWRSSQGRRVVSATPEVGTRRAELRGVLGRSFVLALRSKCSGALADQSMEYCVGFPSSLSLRTLAQRKLAEGESRASDKASACGAHSSRFGRVCCIHPPMLSWMTVRIGSLGKLSPLPSPPGFADRSLSLSSPSPPRDSCAVCRQARLAAATGRYSTHLLEAAASTPCPHGHGRGLEWRTRTTPAFASL
ncbi:unnamed protein product, partial [Prorocentrum cordatum]